MTVLFTSTFPQANGTQLASIDAKWIVGLYGPITSIAVDSSGRLYNTASSTRDAIYNDGPHADTAIEALIYVAQTNGEMSLTFRRSSSSSSSFYALRYLSGQLRWFRVDSGTATALGTLYTVSDTVGLSYTIRGEVEDDTLRMYVNGALQDTVIDNVLSTGYSGVTFSNGRVRINEMLVETISAGTPVPIENTPPIDDQTATVGTPFSLDVGDFFEGTETPFTYTLASGSLTGTGLTLSSGGVLSGTPTTAGTIAGLSVTGTDDASNTDTSNTFDIVVSAAPAGPIVTTHPTNISVVDGGTATFTSAATVSSGGGTMTKQWERSTNSGASWSNFGTADTNLSFTADLSMTGYQYRCKYTDTNGTQYSLVATLTVTSSTAYGFDFNAATDTSQVFGDLAGGLTGLARETAVGIVVRAHQVSDGAVVATSSVLTTDSDGRLPRWTHASLSAATTYHLMFIRQSDGAVCADRMVTT